MPGVFSGKELITIAIDIERRGISFYDVMAKSTDNEAARAVFQGLVAMEREHITVFQEMLDDVDMFEFPESLGQEFADYFRALIDDAVFTDDAITSEMAAQADSDIKALELGISAEKDSILFYFEMRDIMPLRAKPLIDRILDEEKTHLRQLTEIKRTIASD